MTIEAVVFGSRWPVVGSASPFSLKLLTWLRMAEIEHSTTILRGRPASRTGKAPYIVRDDGEILDDSHVIVETLTEAFDVGLDRDRSPRDRALMRLVQNTVEKSLYFVILLRRWGEGWRQTREAYFGDTMPDFVLLVAGPTLRRGALRQARGQGYGLLPADVVTRHAAADLAALEEILGDDDYFFGSPGVTDAIVFGAIENIISCPLDGPEKEWLAGRRLAAHAQRVRERWWS